MTDWPDSWADEPWPLDDPVPAPGLRPVNWSDTHAEPPQVADLADEAWQRAVDRGISMERALAELQREAQFAAELDRGALWHTGGMVALNGVNTAPTRYVAVNQQLLDDAKAMQRAMDDAWRRIKRTMQSAAVAPVMAKVQEEADRSKGDQVLREAKARVFFEHQVERYLSEPRSILDFGGPA